MVVSAKHRVMLWVPSLIFIYLVLGEIEHDRFGELVYRVNTAGFWCSLLLFVAMLLITRGERASVTVGVVLWGLAILALLLLGHSTLFVLHL